MMRGDNVKKLQTELKKRKWLQGPVDGVFGPDTARSVYRAKYWLGYAEQNLDQVAGDLLMNFLTGKQKTSAAMKSRVEKRNKAAETQPARIKMINEARRHIGTKENPPYSNKVLFSTWYGMIGPWCAMFVTYCGVKTGVPQFVRGSRWAYVPYIVNDARAGRNGLAVTYKPLEGDLVCYDWDHDGIADHVGFFEKWISPGNQFAAVEGNTAVGNNSNGGEVMRRTDRYKSNVQAFVHVGG
jgi:hypothetical protein